VLVRLAAEHRLPIMIVSDNGTELTAMLKWANENGVDWYPPLYSFLRQPLAG
jgi:hypothetical protein